MRNAISFFILLLMTSCEQNLKSTSVTAQSSKQDARLNFTEADNFHALMVQETVGSPEEAAKLNDAIRDKATFDGRLVGVGFIGKVDGRMWQGQKADDISLHPGFIPHFSLRTIFKDLKKTMAYIIGGDNKDEKDKLAFDFLGCETNRFQRLVLRKKDTGGTKDGAKVCGSEATQVISVGELLRFTFMVSGAYHKGKDGKITTVARQIIHVDHPNRPDIPTAVFRSNYGLSYAVELITRPSSSQDDVFVETITTGSSLNPIFQNILKSSLGLRNKLPSSISEASYSWYAKERQGKVLALSVSAGLTAGGLWQLKAAVGSAAVAWKAMFATGASLGERAVIMNGIKFSSAVLRGLVAGGQVVHGASKILHASQFVDAMPDKEARAASRFIFKVANRAYNILAFIDLVGNNPLVIRKALKTMINRKTIKHFLTLRQGLLASAKGQPNVIEVAEGASKAAKSIAKTFSRAGAGFGKILSNPLKSTGKLFARAGNRVVNAAKKTLKPQEVGKAISPNNEALAKRVMSVNTKHKYYYTLFRKMLEKTFAARKKLIEEIMSTTSINVATPSLMVLNTLEKQADKGAMLNVIILLAELMGYEVQFTENRNALPKNGTYVFILDKNAETVLDILPPSASPLAPLP